MRTFSIVRYRKGILKLQSLQNGLSEKVTTATIQKIRNLPFFAEHIAAIRLIGQGRDCWSYTAPQNLESFRLLYLHEYSALPTNTQFVERGVKESGYVTLGRRNETNRSVLAIARAKIIPDAICKGKEKLKESLKDVKSLQGKKKSKALLNEMASLQQKIKELRAQYDDEVSFETKFKERNTDLNDSNRQFKKERNQKRVDHAKDNFRNATNPNRWERRTGETLPPLMEGKIQFGLLIKKYNMEQVRNELVERGLENKFDQTTGWRDLLKILKDDKGDEKYFTPRTTYDAFKWLVGVHFDKDKNLL